MSVFNKYIWVVNALYNSKDGLSLRELNEKWVRTDLSGGCEIPRQTFERWKGGIADTLGVDIECNFSNGCYRYSIADRDILKPGELSRWLMDTYTAADALSQYKVLSSRIIVDAIPSSHNYLTDIMSAMRKNRRIEITHRSFERNKSYTFPVEPFCLKLFQRRWYLLAYSVNDDMMRIYGIDRIENLKITDETFDLPEDFDGREYFSSYFGTVLDGSKPVERIVIRATEGHQNYLRTLPLHPTQREIATAEDHADFELYLRPTYDFVMELLRAGSFIEVLEPYSLRNTIRAEARATLDLYKTD